MEQRLFQELVDSDVVAHKTHSRTLPVSVAVHVVGLALVAPVSRQARSQRTAVATAMPNRAAAALRDMPPSTAAITRTRRSSDKVFPIATGLLIQQPW